MAKPNYRFDKRQRELKKNKEQEEKRLKKLAKKEAAQAEAGGAMQPTDAAPALPEKPQ